MSTPMFETATVRNIPLIVEGCGLNINNKTDENSGFPFDSSDREDHPFRSRLDDLAQRHPEFAEHLTDFPFRSNSWGRNRRGSETDPPAASSSGESFPEYRRFADRPFGSRFDRFGFPFTRHFNDRPDFHPEQQQEKETQTAPPHQPQQQQSSQQQQEVHVESPKPPQAPDRSRKVNPNLPQSNTVDLGQKQEPVDDNRSQRSMSAPPDNRSGKRFVSSINIPINRDVGSEEMGNKQSQPEPQQQRSNERVIPIHVEGRDEPVIPKNVHQTFTQPPPQAQRVFGQKPSTFTQFVNREKPQQQQQATAQQQQQATAQQQQATAQQQQTAQPQHTQPSHPQEQPSQQPQPPVTKPTPIDQIQMIQKDVLELMNQVESFAGKPRDKQYLYLDEMLTRNLIKLDNIETEGKDNIRQARKEAIKCIERCIAILENKAAANAGLTLEKNEQPMEVDKSKEIQGDQTQKEADDIKPSDNDQMEVSEMTPGLAKSNSQVKMEIVPEKTDDSLQQMDVVLESNESTNETANTTLPNQIDNSTQPENVPVEDAKEIVPETSQSQTQTNEPEAKSTEPSSHQTEENGSKEKGKKKDKSDKK